MSSSCKSPNRGIRRELFPSSSPCIHPWKSPEMFEYIRTDNSGPKSAWLCRNRSNRQSQNLWCLQEWPDFLKRAECIRRWKSRRKFCRNEDAVKLTTTEGRRQSGVCLPWSYMAEPSKMVFAILKGYGPKICISSFAAIICQRQPSFAKAHFGHPILYHRSSWSFTSSPCHSHNLTYPPTDVDPLTKP